MFVSGHSLYVKGTNRISRISGGYLREVDMAPPSQHQEPPLTPGRFNVAYLAEERSQKRLTSFHPGHNELFFARKVLPVEGEADELAVREVAGRLGVGLDAENVSVIPCGSKSSIPFFLRLCKALAIPHLTLIDDDLRPLTMTSNSANSKLK